MHKQDRRAICGTLISSRVSLWHKTRFSCAKNPLIWHGFIDMINISACQMWHVNLSASAFQIKIGKFFNSLINRLIQCCNHCCEVCEKNSTSPNDKDHQNDIRESLSQYFRVSAF